MKKFLSCTLALLLVLSLSACGQKEATPDKDTPVPDSTPTSSAAIIAKDCEFTVLNCSFKKEVTAQDEELIGSSFSEREGKVFVDLVLKVKNTGNSEITKDTISGYFMYSDLRYDMQFEVESGTQTAFVSGTATVPAQETAIVHLLALVDKAATSESLTVNYTIGDKQYTEAVKQEDTRTALQKKTKVSVGDKIDNGLYSFEVIECTNKQYLQTTNLAEGKQYQPFGNGQFIHLLLKVKNNTSSSLKSITTYTSVGDQITRGNSEKEIKNNLEMEELSNEPLAAGEEQYCHLYVVVDENVNTAGLAIRFNLGGICYYCEVN